MPEVGELILQQHIDGQVSVFGEVPARTSFSLALLERADRSYLAVEGDLVTITLADRSLITYRVLTHDPVTGVVEAELIPDERADRDV